MNGTDQSQDRRTGGETADIGTDEAFNFRPQQLNRVLKLFNSTFEFTYGQRQVSAGVIQAKNMGDNTVEIACRDSDFRYDIVLGLKNRRARVVRVYPLRPPAIQG